MSLSVSFGGGKLEIESDSSNAIKWARGVKRPPWRLITLVGEIKGLIVGLADFFTKNGVEESILGIFHLPGG